MDKTTVGRFLAKVDKTGLNECWNWTAGRNLYGYGQFWMDGKQWGAHRVSYEIYNGPIPTGEGYHGTCVCHSCDNPPCVNPAHLFIGTITDNTRDRNAKGRAQCTQGVAHHQSKLNEAQVRAIRTDPRPHRAIAGDYGITQQHVGKIKRLEQWRHIT
jgi:hypothetical protein